MAQLPSLSLTCTAGGYVETIPFTVATQSDNFMRGHCVLSQCSAYTEVKVNITAQAVAATGDRWALCRSKCRILYGLLDPLRLYAHDPP